MFSNKIHRPSIQFVIALSDRFWWITIPPRTTPKLSKNCIWRQKSCCYHNNLVQHQNNVVHYHNITWGWCPLPIKWVRLNAFHIPSTKVTRYVLPMAQLLDWLVNGDTMYIYIWWMETIIWWLQKWRGHRFSISGSPSQIIAHDLTSANDLWSKATKNPNSQNTKWGINTIKNNSAEWVRKLSDKPLSSQMQSNNGDTQACWFRNLLDWEQHSGYQPITKRSVLMYVQGPLGSAGTLVFSSMGGACPLHSNGLYWKVPFHDIHHRIRHTGWERKMLKYTSGRQIHWPTSQCCVATGSTIRLLFEKCNT